MFTVHTEEFSGPLEALAKLIDEKKLDITRVHLAQVTGDFLVFVEGLKKQIEEEEQQEGQISMDDLRLLADFLIVAARLILIKSRSLVPGAEVSQEEENEMMDLERRLLWYRRMRPVFIEFKRQWTESGQMFERGETGEARAVFYPSDAITTSGLQQAMARIAGEVRGLVVARETVQRQSVSLKDTIRHLSDVIKQGRATFSQLTKSGSRQEAVVSFLALLHLLRDSMIVVRQEGLFSEIHMESTDHDS